MGGAKRYPSRFIPRGDSTNTNQNVRTEHRSAERKSIAEQSDNADRMNAEIVQQDRDPMRRMPQKQRDHPQQKGFPGPAPAERERVRIAHGVARQSERQRHRDA